MVRGVNKVLLIGNLAADPSFRLMPDGVTGIATVSLATNEGYRDQQTGQMQERTEWHRLVMWGRTAEIARDYLRKGSSIYVEGKLRSRSYDDKDGIKRYVTEVVVNDLQMLGSKNAQPGNQQLNNYGNPNMPQAGYGNNQGYVANPGYQGQYSNNQQGYYPNGMPNQAMPNQGYGAAPRAYQQRAAQPMPQPAVQPMPQPAVQPMPQPVAQPMPQPVAQPMPQTAGKPYANEATSMPNPDTFKVQAPAESAAPASGAVAKEPDMSTAFPAPPEEDIPF